MRRQALPHKCTGHVEVRVKRCGKSAPRRRQRRWQAKPRTEQDQIGWRSRTARPRPPGRSPEPVSNHWPRGMIVPPSRASRAMVGKLARACPPQPERAEVEQNSAYRLTATLCSRTLESPHEPQSTCRTVRLRCVSSDWHCTGATRATRPGPARQSWRPPGLGPRAGVPNPKHS